MKLLNMLNMLNLASLLRRSVGARLVGGYVVLMVGLMWVAVVGFKGMNDLSAKYETELGACRT